MELDRRKDNIDFVMSQIQRNNKRGSFITYTLTLAILAVAAIFFYTSIKSITEELRKEVEANSQKIEQYEELKLELRYLGRALADSQAVSPRAIEIKKVEDVIAKEVNRRQLSNIEKESLEQYKGKYGSDFGNENAIDFLVESLNDLDEGKLNSALDKVSSAIQIDSANAVAYTLKADILSRLEDYEGALDAQSKAIEIEKEKPFSSIIPNYYNTRGFIQLRLKDYEAAIANFEDGTNTASGDEKAFIGENIVYTYLLQGDWQRALDKSTDILALRVDGGWNQFLRAIAADKLNKSDLSEKSLNAWLLDADENTKASLRKALEGTAINEYSSWIERAS